MNDKEKKAKKKSAPQVKAGAEKSTQKNVATAEKKSAASPAKKSKATLTPEQRFRLVQEAAYYIAQKDGFRGDPCGYWLAAEAQVAKDLA
ncbi:MAG TPA: DUF2934 domain-containing protein [bacterium]